MKNKKLKKVLARIGIIGSIASILGVILFFLPSDDKDRIKIDNTINIVTAESQGETPEIPKIRFKYLLCTGPYNNFFVQKDSSNFYHLKDNLFVIKNELTELLFKLEKGGMGVGTFTFIPELLIDSLAGVPETLWGEFDNNESYLDQISKEHKRAISKLKYYKEFFESFEFTSRNVRDIFGKEYLPESSNLALDYYEDLDIKLKAILEIHLSKEHSAAQTGVLLYHNSMRNLILEIENISSEILTDVRIGMRVKESEKQNKNNFSLEELKFPLKYLKPNEKILIPLSIKSVPFIHAERYIYEDDFKRYIDFNSSPKKNLIKMDSFKLIQSFKNGTFKKISPTKLSSDDFFYEKDFDFLNQELTIDDFPKNIMFGNAYSEKSFHIGKRYIPTKVTYKSSMNTSRLLSEFRKMNSENLIMVNDNCECGSCPILSYVNMEGQIRRVQEFLIKNKKEVNQDSFLLKIPKTAEFIILQENRGETAFIRNLELIIKTNDGNFVVGEKTEKQTIDYNKPLIFELSSLMDLPAIEKSDIECFYLRGIGFYESRTAKICDKLFPIEEEYLR